MDALLVSTGYIPVEPELRLPKALREAEDVVRSYDPELRLRQSLKRELRQQGCGFILERRARYEKPTHTETKVDLNGDLLREADVDVRVASRDGYLVISPVHVSLLLRPEAMVERLKEGDHANRRWQDRFQDIIDGQLEGKQQRKKARLDNNKAWARESFDILDRIGDPKTGTERTRVSNAGGERAFNITDRRRVTPEGFALEASSAGEIPAQESSDEHQTGSARSRQDGELHGQSEP